MTVRCTLPPALPPTLSDSERGCDASHAWTNLNLRLPRARSLHAQVEVHMQLTTPTQRPRMHAVSMIWIYFLNDSVLQLPQCFWR